MNMSKTISKYLALACLISCCYSVNFLSMSQVKDMKATVGLQSTSNVSQTICPLGNIKINSDASSILIYCIDPKVIYCDLSKDFVGCTTCMNGYSLYENITYTFSTNSGGQIQSTLNGCLTNMIMYVVIGLGVLFLSCIACCVCCCVRACRKRPIVVNGGDQQGNAPVYYSVGDG